MPLSEKAQRYWFGRSLVTYLQDYDVNGNLIYEGYSNPNTPQTALGWVIIQHLYNPVTIQGATIYEDTHDGILAGISWTLRSVYTYP